MVKFPSPTFSCNVMGTSDCLFATKETGSNGSEGLCKSLTSSWSKLEYKKGMENTTQKVPRSGSPKFSANSFV